MRPFSILNWILFCGCFCGCCPIVVVVVVVVFGSDSSLALLGARLRSLEVNPVPLYGIIRFRTCWREDERAVSATRLALYMLRRLWWDIFFCSIGWVWFFVCWERNENTQGKTHKAMQDRQDKTQGKTRRLQIPSSVVHSMSLSSIGFKFNDTFKRAAICW